MNLTTRIKAAAAVLFGGASPANQGSESADVRMRNDGQYSEDVMAAFGVAPPASAGVAVTATSAMRVAAVFACVQRIAGAISTMPVHQYARGKEAEERLPVDNAWFKLNEEPHDQLTAASHWEGVSAQQLLRGDAYTWVRRTMSNGIRELLPCPWGSVQPMRQRDGSVRYYVSLPEFNIYTWLDASEVLHFPGFGFDMHRMRSMSVIQHAARNAVGNALAMDQYSGAFFANGAHPSIVLKTPNKMNDVQREQLREAFMAKYSGMANAHKLPLVLTEGLDAKEISVSAEDAQLLDARKFQVIDIARAFGVPPHMIGETTGSSAVGAGYEAQGRNFVTYTLQAHLVRIEQELNRKLFPRNAGRFWRFDRDALIEGDSKAQAEYNRAALGGPGTGQGWMTVNEIRKAKGLPPVEGGDVLFDPRTAQKGTT